MRRAWLLVVALGTACSSGLAPTLPPGLGSQDDDGGVTPDSGMSDGGSLDAGPAGLPDGGLAHSPDGGAVAPPDGGPAPDGGMLSFDAGQADAGGPACTLDGGSVEVAPPAGTYVGPIDVTITVPDGAAIDYTTDGSDPLTSATAMGGSGVIVLHFGAPAQVTLSYALACASATERQVMYTLLAANPSSISGAVVIQPLLLTTSAQVEVLLYDQDPVGNTNAMAVGFTDISPSSPEGTNYLFQGEAPGQYWVAAAWWPGTPTGDPQAFALARENPITLSAMSAIGGVDVYIGECDPQGTGVDGVVTIDSSLQSDIVGVAAYQQTLTLANLQMPNPMPSETAAPGEGTQRPFALCGLTTPNVNILAAATAAGATDPAALSAYAMNPVATDPVSHISLYLGVPQAGVGGVGGSITLSGPLPMGEVTLAATSEPWSPDAPFAGYVTVPTGMETQYTYDVSGLIGGGYYLTAIALDGDGTSFVPLADSPFTLTSAALQATINLQVNVGRAYGTISVTNAANAPAEVVVGTVSAGRTPTIVGSATVTMGPADSTGTSQATYDVFGIPDGMYQAIALFEINGDTSFQESLEKGDFVPAADMLPSVAIQQGSAVEVDFSGQVP